MTTPYIDQNLRWNNNHLYLGNVHIGSCVDEARASNAIVLGVDVPDLQYTDGTEASVRAAVRKFAVERLHQIIQAIGLPLLGMTDDEMATVRAAAKQADEPVGTWLRRAAALRDMLDRSDEKTANKDREPGPSLLHDIRKAGWDVSVHTKYKVGNTDTVLWLFQKDGVTIKGEGLNETAALNSARQQLDLPAL